MAVIGTFWSSGWLLSVPLFFLDWQYQATAGTGDLVAVDALAHLIVFLSAIKLLQVKSDRDWVFLFLTSFFEVLLAAGLSSSARLSCDTNALPC